MRLLQSMKLDVQLQARNYLYQIVFVLAVFAGLGLWYFFDEPLLGRVLPAFFLFVSAGTGYMFVAALVLFEKRENTLKGLVVTPLRPSEYIQSKLITLTALGVGESLIVLILAYVVWYGLGFNILLFLVGVIGLTLINTLAGLIIVVRYDSINNFLMPTLLFAAVTQIPFTAAFGLWEPFFFYALPTFPPLLLVLGAFDPISTGQLVYGVVGTAVVIGLLYWWSQIAFDRHIMQKLG